jgi:hypothetical protein
VTGDLKIVEDKEIRWLLTQGPRYRERRKIDGKESEKIIKESIDGVIERWAEKEEIVIGQFKQWKEQLLSGLDEALVREKEKGVGEEKGQILEDKKSKKALKDLLDRYVLVSADKSENNVIVVCRRYYVQRIREEIEGKGEEEEEKTYRREVGRQAKEIVSTIVEELKDDGIEVPAEHLELATLYATVKMHKDPVGLRFIASSRRCVTKRFSQLLSKCLKAVQGVLRRDDAKRYRKTGIKRFWIVESADEVIVEIERLGRDRMGRTVASFDFSTLYTMIEHDSLKDMLYHVILEAFRIADKRMLAVYSKKASFVDSVREGAVGISAMALCRLVRVLIDNMYVMYGESVYRQCVGVPMGTDCAPFLANLYYMR